MSNSSNNTNLSDLSYYNDEIDQSINMCIHILKKEVKSRKKADIDFLSDFTKHLDYFQNRFDEDELEKARRTCCKAMKYEVYKAG